MNLWVFDNDNTLYDRSAAEVEFTRAFWEYFASFSRLRPDLVVDKISELKRKWKTEFSLICVMKEYGLDFTEIVKNTYLKMDVRRCEVPVPDLAKRIVLDSLYGRKVVFTNGPSAYARLILSHIGLMQNFSDVVGMEEMDFFLKPDPRSYLSVETRNPGFEKIIFCDDSLENLEGARLRGWTTVWFNPNGIRSDNVCDRHIVISSFEQLEAIA